jgi:subtilisin family serine protease
MFRRLLLTLIALTLLSLTASARESDKWTVCERVPGHVIVKFRASTKLPLSAKGDPTISVGVPSLDQLFKEFEVSNLDRLIPDGILNRFKTPPDMYTVYVIVFRPEFSELDAIDAFAADPNVKSVQPDILNRVYRNPNDALWSDQWDKRIVHAPAVWDVCTGSRDIICAGIDTGVDWNHPDLVPNLWVNPGEDLNHNGLPYTNPNYPGDLDDADGTDSDSNGYADDFLGWDFIRNIGGCATGEDCDGGMDNDMSGINPHGTHVAGLMVARGNNSIGVAGMSWYGRLMAVRAGYQATNGDGYTPESASDPATAYAAAMGAKILNMSFGGPGTSDYTQGIITAAWNQGCLIFAASGNEGSTTESYPAAYENVIAVNATDNQDRLAWWSNRGTWTDICAPGADPGIMSTIIDGYGSMEGTSMASPNAAGVAALVWSAFPNMTNTQVQDLLFSTAVDISSHNSGVPRANLGHGRIDAYAAVASLYPHMEVTSFSISDAVNGDGDGRLERGESGQLILTSSNIAGWANGQSLTATITSDDPNLVVTNGVLTLGDIPQGGSMTNTANPVILSVPAGMDTVCTDSLHITFSSPDGYAETLQIGLTIGRGRVLVVDHDGSADYEQYYLDAIHTAGYTTDVWSVTAAGAITPVELTHYSVVLWSCGDQNIGTISSEDQVNLTTYLNAGHNLIVVGQNIDEDLHAAPFYADYLHAASASATGSRQLSGVAGNGLSQGMTLILNGNSCGGNGGLSPSQITPINGALPLFNYDAGGTGAIQYSGSYKLAYFAFALEAACGLSNSTRYDVVVDSLLRWMTGPEAAEPTRTLLPQTTALQGNYPNPFNPATTITFDLAAAKTVRLTVFDLLGRSVTTLVDGRLAAGRHAVTFDGSGRPSGVYFVRLQAGEYTATQRMVLLK